MSQPKIISNFEVLEVGEDKNIDEMNQKCFPKEEFPENDEIDISLVDKRFSQFEIMQFIEKPSFENLKLRLDSLSKRIHFYEFLTKVIKAKLERR